MPTQMFIALLIIIAKDGDNTKCYQLLDKQNVAIHTVEYYSTIKKKC